MLRRWLNFIKIRYFNSIKVRLEHAEAKQGDNQPNLFQFHKGTIRTMVSMWWCVALTLFQFHKGTIRTLLTNLMLMALLNFNSIKVRLEHNADKALGIAAGVFQFHKGTIRTHLCLWLIISFWLFQFHKGTIRTLCLDFDVFCPFIISIP